MPHSMYQFKIKEKPRTVRLTPPSGFTGREWEDKITGTAYYRLSQDGANVANGTSMDANLVWMKSTRFGADTCAPTGSPTLVPTQAPFEHSTFCPGQSHFTLDFRHGRSTRWKLYDDHTGRVLAQRGWSFFDLYYDRLRPYHHDYCFPPSQSHRYKFMIEGKDWLGFEFNSEHGVYSLKENGIPVAAGMAPPTTPSPVPLSTTYPPSLRPTASSPPTSPTEKRGLFDFTVTQHEETVFGRYDENWEPPTIPTSPADISNGLCPPCHVFTLVGCISCDLFQGVGGTPKCDVSVCQRDTWYVPEERDISYGLCSPCEAAIFKWKGSYYGYTGIENFPTGYNIVKSKSSIDCIPCAAYKEIPIDGIPDPYPTCQIAACDADVKADEAVAASALCEEDYIDAGKLFVDEGPSSLVGSSYSFSLSACRRQCDGAADCQSFSYNDSTYGDISCFTRTKCGSDAEPVVERLHGTWDIAGWHTYYKPMSCCSAVLAETPSGALTY